MDKKREPHNDRPRDKRRGSRRRSEDPPPGGDQVVESGATAVAHVAGGEDPERRQRFVLKLLDALRALPDPEAIQAEVDRRLVEHLAADRAFYAEVSADEEVLVAVDHAADAATSIVGRYPLEAFGQAAADTLRAGRTLVFAKVAAAELLSSAEREACLQLGIGALVKVPRIQDGRLVALLAVHQLQPRNWQTDEIALIEEVAERTWVFVERAKAETALRASERRFRSLFEGMGLGYVLLELVRGNEGRVTGHRLLAVNPAFERFAGTSTPDAERGPDRLPWADKVITGACDRVARSGRPERFEQQIAALGHWFDVRIYAEARDRVIVLLENIDRRKHAEAVLRDNEDRQAFVLKLSDALRVPAAPRAMAVTGLRLLADHLQLDRAWIAGRATPGDRAQIGPEWRREGLTPIADANRTTGFPESDPQVAHATLVVADVESDTSVAGPDASSLAAAGVGAFICTGLRGADAGVALVAAMCTARAWTWGEIQLVEAAAERISAAVERACADAARRARDEHYRRLFDSIDEGFCTIALLFDEAGAACDYRFLSVNAAFEQQTGLRNVVGRTIREMAPRHELQWFDVYGRIARSGQPERFEQGAAALGFWYDVYAFPLGGPGSAELGVLFKDVSERKRAESNLELLNNVSREVAMLSTPDEIMAAVGSAVGIALDASACAFADVDQAAGIVTVTHGWCVPEVPILDRAFELARYMTTDDFVRASRAGDTVVVRDTGHDPRTDGPAHAALGIGAFVAVPFVLRGQWVAFLAVTDREPRDWRADEIAVLEEITGRVFPRIERGRAEAALRLSEERYRSLFECIDEGFCVMEIEREGDGVTGMVYREINPAFERLTGLHDVIGKSTHELFPSLEHYWLDAVAKVAATGVPVRMENYQRDLGRWYDLQYARVGGAGSRFVAAVFNDTTERRRAEEAANRLAAIVESSDDAIIRKNLDGIIETWNAGAERMFGYAAEEVIGKSITILMPPERVAEEPGILARIRRGDRIDHFETVRRRKDGSLLDVSLTISPVVDRHGAVVAASKIARDITANKRAERALRASDDRQRFLLAVSDGMREQSGERAIGDVCVRMLAAQMHADRCYITRLRRQDATGLLGSESRRADLPSVYGPSGEVALSGFPEIIRVLETGTVVLADAARDPRLSATDRASLAPLRMPAFIAAALREGERNFTWALVVGSAEPREWTADDVRLVEDVAERTWAFIERNRVEVALREREAELQRASLAKDEFLAMLGHELRNPLAPITTTLQLMKLRAPHTFARERDVIEGQVAYLTGLVDDLLDVARIARGTFALKLERVDLKGVVEDAIETTQSALEERRQVLHAHADPGIVVSGERRRLVQVLVNLLGNAAKYSPPGRNVYLSVGARDGVAEIRVRDEGQGIAPELLPHVFESFTQDTQSIERARGGLGLGLAIVRNIVALHGGSVSAASEGSFKGSEFVVTLPLLECGEPAADAAETEPRQPAAPKREARRIRVLIVDDYALAAESLAMLLQEMGYHTRVARDGAEGLQAIGEFKPQVALVDIGLPVIDGYEVAQTVRTTPGSENLPLVAVTGYGQASDRERVLAAGFNEHLVKPLDAAKIGDLIERLVNAVAE